MAYPFHPLGTNAENSNIPLRFLHQTQLGRLIFYPGCFLDPKAERKQNIVKTTLQFQMWVV